MYAIGRFEKITAYNSICSNNFLSIVSHITITGTTFLNV